MQLSGGNGINSLRRNVIIECLVKIQDSDECFVLNYFLIYKFTYFYLLTQARRGLLVLSEFYAWLFFISFFLTL